MENFISKALNIAILKNRPVSLIHFLTNRCNARCQHCFIDFEDVSSQKSSMKLSDIDKLTRNIGGQLMNVNFTGGEPFLEPNIKKICDLYLNNTKIDSIFFSTNGAMTKSICDLASYLKTNYGSKTFIFSISIDHIGDRHSNYRNVKQLYEKALRTYHSLASLGGNINVNITITVSEYNCEECEYIFDTLWSKEKVNSITANIVRNEGVYKINKEKIEAIKSGYDILVKKLIQNNLHYNGKNYLTKMMSRKELIMYQNISEVYLNPYYVLPCHAGAGLMGVIYPNGDVFPCEILEDKMGNLYDYEMNLNKLWADNSKLRKKIKNDKCHCTYECAWSYNILSSPKHMADLLMTGISPNEKDNK